MSSSRINQISMDFNPGVFRYWQPIEQIVYEVLYNRNPYANYYAEGIVREAFAKGFDIMLGDKEHPRNDEILSDTRFNDTMEKLYKAIAAKRWGGFCLLFFGEVEDQSMGPQLYWVIPRLVNNMDIEPFTNTVRSAAFQPPLYESQINNFNEILIDSSNADMVKLLGDYTEQSGKYRSIYEKVFDDLVGITNISQQIVLKQIRVGSGVRIYDMTFEEYSDENLRNDAKKQLEEMGVNSLFVGALGEDGESKLQLYFGEGSMSSKEDKEEILTNLAAATRIPVEAWRGGMVSLSSGTLNRDQLLNQYSKIDTEEEETVIWGLDKVFEINVPVEGVEEVNHIWLRFKPLEEEDPVKAFTMLKDKLTLVQSLAPDFNRMGMKQDELYSLLDLTLTIDESLQAKFEEEKTMLLNTANTDDNEDGDDSETEDPPAIPGQEED